MPEWVHHHTLAMCQTDPCQWHRRYDGTDTKLAALIVRAAGDHAKMRGHYVQVERGAHAHYDGWRASNQDSSPKEGA